MSGKETKTSLDKRPAARVRGTRTRNCPCGQQLDVCSRAHCPRCGRTLNR
ncbi:MAG: hypothetical protein ACXVXC_09650 [Nocardioidaceae bacterium]